MTILCALAITVPVTGLIIGPKHLLNPEAMHLTFDAEFVYGSGGTSVDAYIQTLLDPNGLSWIDVANFHFTTSSARKVCNLSALTPVTTFVTPTDGALTSNTAQDGIFGDQWRVKFTSVGTYAATSLKLYCNGARMS